MPESVTLPSKLDSVDVGENLVLDQARRMGFDEDSLHEIGISVRESLVNAVAHGNRYNARKQVGLSVRTDTDRLEIEITDEGAGFDLEEVPDPRGEENILRHSGRGLLMIRAFMDEFSVQRRQPAGTLVKMVKLRKRPAGA
jgi:serine/threonine-protein kinase RsbW